MADTSVKTGLKTRKGAKSKLSKLFRRKKRHSEFGSRENIVDHIEDTQNDGSSVDLAENGARFQNNEKKGQSLFKSAAKRRNKTSEKKKQTGKPGTTDKFSTADASNSQRKGGDERSGVTEDRSRTNSPVGADPAELGTVTAHIEIIDNNQGEKTDTPQCNRQTGGVGSDGDHTNTKSGKSRAFKKLKRKLHLSNYKELSEETISNIKIQGSDEEGFENIKKKKRLQQTGKTVRRALRTGLKSFVDGFQSLSPMSTATSYCTNTYYSTDGKNYNPYFTRTKPNVVNLFT